MAMPGGPRDDLDIPDRPKGTVRGARGVLARWRPFLYGAAGAGAVVVVASLALSLFDGQDKVAGGGDVPLIKPEEAPIKTSPDAPGGMNVPNRGLLVYEQMQQKQPDAKAAGKPPVERLLPDPEEPLQPPRAAPQPGDAPPPEPAGVGADTRGPLPAPPENSADDRRSLDQLIAELPPDPPPAAAPEARPAASEKEKKPLAEKKAPAEKPAAPAVVAQPKAPTPAEARKPAQPASVPTEKAAAAKKGGYVVQLFAGRSAEEAKAAWTKMQSRNGDLLGGLGSQVARADLGDRGTFYRLRAGPLESEAKARALCAALSGRGQSCIIVRSGA